MSTQRVGRARAARARRERHERAVEFFYKHAGWGYDPKKETAEQGRRRGAELLAQAEEWAFAHDWTYVWKDDWSVDHKKEFDIYKRKGPETCEACVLYS